MIILSVSFLAGGTLAFAPATITAPIRSSIATLTGTPTFRQQWVPNSRTVHHAEVGKDTATSSSSSSTLSQTDDVEAPARDALNNVGWSLPTEGDLTSEDPFVRSIDAGIQRDVGVPLDGLLNPAKVVNLERDLYTLRLQLATVTGRDITVGEDLTALVTADCDGGGGGEAADTLRKAITKKETDLATERRSVFRGWLKNIFLGQAVISFALSYVMATNPAVLFGGFDWFYTYSMEVSIQVLGYWWWWLFVIPSLRSRRPRGLEKKALDIAFVASPAISLIAPLATKDTGLIWTANLLIVAGSYAFAYSSSPEASGVDEDDDSNTPAWLKFIFKSLDFGSGRERGARK